MCIIHRKQLNPTSTLHGDIVNLQYKNKIMPHPKKLQKLSDIGERDSPSKKITPSPQNKIVSLVSGGRSP